MALAEQGRMENTHAFVRAAAWLASLSAAAGDQRSAESYVLGILAWYVTCGGTLVVTDEPASLPS
jgi:hypothetical protein